MSITKKGKKWEILNSLWIIWTFTWVFNSVAFFWISLRAKHKKWILFGWLYLLLGFVPMYFSGEIINNNFSDSARWKQFADILGYISLVSCIVSIIHAFLIRKSYLVRREYVIDNAEKLNEEFREKILRQAANSELISATEKPEKISVSTVDLNTCSEQDLAALPGIGVARAKKAVMLRSEKGNFSSVDSFVEALGVEPHFAVQIKKLAIVSESVQNVSAPAKNISEPAHRKVDV